MTQPLEQSLLAAWPLQAWKNTRLLVAVSGGADSVALVHALARVAESREFIHVAHFNHGWRGVESDEDERFVQNLCNELKLPLANERAAAGLARSENAARESRYEFLTRVAYSIGARYVVTAHTASDRVETMLHNLCRGTGLSGVAVPTQFRNLHDELVLARPLLRSTRTEVLAYLDAIGQTYREDSSNYNPAFKRNFIRQRVLPLLRESYSDGVDQHLLSFSQLAEEAVETLRHYALKWIDASVAQPTLATNDVQFSTSSLDGIPWPVIQAALELCWKRNCWPLQSMTREHWQQIRHFATHPAPTTHWVAHLNLPGNLQLATTRTQIRISSISNHS